MEATPQTGCPSCQCAKKAGNRADKQHHRSCVNKMISCKLDLIEALRVKESTYVDEANTGQWGPHPYKRGKRKVNNVGAVAGRGALSDGEAGQEEQG